MTTQEFAQFTVDQFEDVVKFDYEQLKKVAIRHIELLKKKENDFMSMFYYDEVIKEIEML